MQKSQLTQRIRLIVFSNLLQATLLKKVSNDEKASIVISIYGYTKEFDHIQFEYEIKFIDEQKRDRVFDEIKDELLLEDIEKLVKENDIPIVLK